MEQHPVYVYNYGKRDALTILVGPWFFLLFLVIGLVISRNKPALFYFLLVLFLSLITLLAIIAIRTLVLNKRIDFFDDRARLYPRPLSTRRPLDIPYSEIAFKTGKTELGRLKWILSVKEREDKPSRDEQWVVFDLYIKGLDTTLFSWLEQKISPTY